MNAKEIDGVFHCDCGFSWSRGKNGSHNCADGLREKLQQLAAENVGLKAGIREAFEEMESHHDTDGLYSYDADGEQMDALIRLCDAQGEISDLLSMVETPATDRIVAGIKADGVDIIRNALIKFVEDEVGPNDLVPGLVRGAEICVSVADSLREGADK
ncbi:TPA: hypothetical protein ACNP4C_000026 [Klebsiella oxytoca]|uniref:hypothetical protein n=1 Tax=Klebsiella oxytoca TaxID=571 RepID=UPI0029936A71|nr:hypothetical protein [Klebsiella oxytoca]